MDTADTTRLILQALEEGAEAEGIEIIAVDISGSRRSPVISVRIDSLGADSINLDEIALHTPYVSKTLDALDERVGLFQGPYDLQVSSPGLDRPLTKPAHYQRFAGNTVVVSTYSGERKKFTGVLGAPRIEEDSILIPLDANDTQYLIEYTNIKSCRLKPDYTQLFKN